MQIGTAGLTKLSQMICGDEPFSFFPYRSSSNLTNFFVDLDLDYVHDGSTRRYWVFEVLKELNNNPPLTPQMPSPQVIKVVEYLLHPDHFIQTDKSDRNRALDTIRTLLKNNNLTLIEMKNGQVEMRPIHGEFVSTSHEIIPPTEKLITFTPSIFQVPNKPLNEKLISVMMPFNTAFSETYNAIKRTADHMKLDCLRADDIWDNSTFIQDIFDLIFCAKVVIVDFTGRNSNVMYETGIAHTLGKIVIPITQSLDDIPSDLGHHRALKYLPNEEGYRELSNELFKRLKT
ncbi:TPA: hypothetical protein KLD48_003016, partial [Legionella pneumophila]|nr:hypothetical protein [Legionella pneumophila]